jgi:hypothetical protein
MHYPVVNRNGDTIASAVTNLDLHDISRVVKTYGARAFYVVTPLVDQKLIVERIISHWTAGVGSWYNPARKEALETINLKASLEEVVEHIQGREEGPPKTVAICARSDSRSVSYGDFREIIRGGGPFLLIFGTAWGLSNEVIREADYILEPITGDGEYNHLSVRCAAAVVLDRLTAKNSQLETTH